MAAFACSNLPIRLNIAAEVSHRSERRRVSMGERFEVDAVGWGRGGGGEKARGSPLSSKEVPGKYDLTVEVKRLRE